MDRIIEIPLGSLIGLCVGIGVLCICAGRSTKVMRRFATAHTRAHGGNATGGALDAQLRTGDQSVNVLVDAHGARYTDEAPGRRYVIDSDVLGQYLEPDGSLSARTVERLALLERSDAARPEVAYRVEEPAQLVSWPEDDDLAAEQYSHAADAERLPRWGE